MAFAYTPKQHEARQLLAGPQRHSLLVGGGRSGKTVILVDSLVRRAIRVPRSNHAILRFRQNAVRKSIWQDPSGTLRFVVRECIPGLRGRVHWTEGDCLLTLANGSTVWCTGVDEKERVDRILGLEFATILFNECSQIPYPSITTVLTRLSQRCIDPRTGQPMINRAYYDLNPVGKSHYTYKQFIEHVEPVSKTPLDPAAYRHLFMNPRDNAQNLDPEYLKSLDYLPQRQKKRFLEGVYVDEFDGALWTPEIIGANRVQRDDVPNLERIVVAIDPSGASSSGDTKNDAIGIVGAGIASNGHAYVLRDRSILDSPERWARVVDGLYDEIRADRVVGEQNFGGDMVRAVVHSVNEFLPYTHVHASRGKVVRAEPIAALYEKGNIHHVGTFDDLEEELCAFTTGGYMGMGSPNRADAAIWALTHLFEGFGTPNIRSFA